MTGDEESLFDNGEVFPTEKVLDIVVDELMVLAAETESRVAFLDSVGDMSPAAARMRRISAALGEAVSKIDLESSSLDPWRRTRRISKARGPGVDVTVRRRRRRTGLTRAMDRKDLRAGCVTDQGKNLNGGNGRTSD